MKYVFLISLVLFFISCEQSPKTQMMQSWHGSMRGLANSLTAIMPQLVTRRGEVARSEKKKLKQAINDLQSYGDSLEGNNMVIPSKDPTLKYIAKDFRAEVKRVKERSSKVSAYETQKDLQHLTRYCIACHTKTPSGSSHLTQSMGNSVQDLDDIEKGQFYMAMRQFEKALVHLETGLTNRDWAKKHPDEWNKAAMQLLAVTVRVHDDPRLTLEMISRLFDTNAYPRQLEQAARVWRQDAKEWAEKGKKRADLDGLGDLLLKAQGKENRLANSGLILNLRAQARLNRYLKAGGLSKASEQSVLYFSGILTERLDQLNFSGFAKSYFRACLEINPTSQWGRLCQPKI